MCLSGSTHTYMQHIYVAHLAYPKVRRKSVSEGGVEEESRDQQRIWELILLIGLWADCCAASLIC